MTKIQIEFLKSVQKIPLVSCGFTNNDYLISELGITFDAKEEQVRFHLDLQPNLEVEGDMLACYFGSDNRASISDNLFFNENKSSNKLVGKDILGFEGTWEEVKEKLLKLTEFAGKE